MPAVVIVGGGPAGLTAARVLARSGMRDLVLLEREGDLGGAPRHCGHLGFGMLDLRRLLTGPRYARALAGTVEGLDLRPGVSVTRLLPGGHLEVSGPNGVETMSARAIILATGTRETPRAARLVSGTRPWGVMNTGAFQQFAYLAGRRPFERPVIVGSELVAFSALLTARHLGIRPVAMIEPNARITARRPLDLAARWAFGVPVRTGTSLQRILGDARVEGVEVRFGDTIERIACDGVVLTGGFVPEASLVQASHLELDPATGGPSIDQYWRCSDPAWFVAGNLIRPVEHAGRAALEGAAAAHAVLRHLAGDLPAPDRVVRLAANASLAYAYPQRIACPGEDLTNLHLLGRVRQSVRGRLQILRAGAVLLDQPIRALPERRVRIPIDRGWLDRPGSLDIRITVP
jgi:thioredoxin reductase